MTKLDLDACRHIWTGLVPIADEKFLQMTCDELRASGVSLRTTRVSDIFASKDTAHRAAWAVTFSFRLWVKWIDIQIIEVDNRECVVRASEYEERQDDPLEAVQRIILEDLEYDPLAFYAQALATNKLEDVASWLEVFLRQNDNEILLKQERAFIVLEQWKHGLESCTDELLRVMTNPIKKTTEFELHHCFQKLRKELDAAMVSEKFNSIRFAAIENHVSYSSGVRFALSSANASDNYTWHNVEPEGGLVLNGCANVAERPEELDEPTVEVHVDLIDGDSGICFESDDRIGTVGLKTCIVKDGYGFFNYLNDSNDHFRLLKHVLVFFGILTSAGQPLFLGNSLSVPTDLDLENQLAEFLRRAEKPSSMLKIRVTNRGPSRSGFASSSVVSLCLVSAFVKLLRLEFLREFIPTLVWLFENQLGLKSGRQDIDGPFNKCFSSLHYCTSLNPVIERFNIKGVEERIVLIDTGIPRSSLLDLKRGLNIRHLKYLIRDRDAYLAMKKSLVLHNEMKKALSQSDWKRLGEQMAKYTEYRELIDDTAMRSCYDNEFKAFPEFLKTLRNMNVIYGGMLSGAMGGGVFILVLQDNVQDFDKMLDQMKECLMIGSEKPFKNARRLYFRLSKE